MNRCIGVFFVFSLMFFATFGVSFADLNIFIGDLNNQGYANRDDYSYRLSNQFGVPSYRVDSILREVREPADAFMIYQLGRMLNIAPERVFETYQSSRGQGWGEIAKRLGIKPGSPEFHALKNGDFSFNGKPGKKYDDHNGRGYSTYDDNNKGKGKYKEKEVKWSDDSYQGGGNGKGKGKGHNK